MREYHTEALVLDKESVGERDARVTLYTETLGRIVATVTSARKITSKLSPHLEPMNFALVRLTKKNSFHVTDALKSGTFAHGIEVVKVLRAMTMESEPDPELWFALKRGKAAVPDVLRILGFDSQLALCELCNQSEPVYFILARSCYCCGNFFPSLLKQHQYVSLGALGREPIQL